MKEYIKPDVETIRFQDEIFTDTVIGGSGGTEVCDADTEL